MAVATPEKIKGWQNYVFANPLSAGGPFALVAFHVTKSCHSVRPVLSAVLQTRECSHVQIKRSIDLGTGGPSPDGREALSRDGRNLRQEWRPQSRQRALHPDGRLQPRRGALHQNGRPLTQNGGPSSGGRLQPRLKAPAYAKGPLHKQEAPTQTGGPPSRREAFRPDGRLQPRSEVLHQNGRPLSQNGGPSSVGRPQPRLKVSA